MASAAEAPAASVSDVVKFSDVAKLMSAIAKSSGQVKSNLLTSFMANWRRAASSPQDTFYPVMRLLLPHLDKQRTAYGLKELTLAKLYPKVLGLAEKGQDATKLLNYRIPEAVGEGNAGDFAGLVMLVLNRRAPPAVEDPLSVRQVNSLLDQLSRCSSKEHVKTRITVMRALVQGMTPADHKWLVRIILRDLKIGLNESSVFRRFHPDAVNLYSKCADMQKLCLDLHDFEHRLQSIDIVTFSPFRPMLAQKMEDVHAGLKSLKGDFFMEVKYDGDRMQIHRDGTNYRYFTRRATDYSERYGCTPDDGTFTPRIHPLMHPHVRSCILDGEMMMYDSETRQYVTKGESDVDVKGGFHRDSKLQPCFILFDIVMLNGKPLIHLPLSQRRDILRSSVLRTQQLGVVVLADAEAASTEQDFLRFANKCIDETQEGVILKRADSVYKPDARVRGGWFKWKPEYADGLADTLDVLIIGGYYGEGKRCGQISKFLVAVCEDPPAGEDPTVFHSFARVGSGYTMAEMRKYNELLSPRWRRYRKDSGHGPCGMGPGVRLAAGGKIRPDVYIAPQDSLIAEIKASEIVPSDVTSAGYTLRFPSIKAMRMDKSWRQCMTISQMQAARQKGGGTLSTRHVAAGAKGAQKRRKVQESRKPREVMSQFKPADLTGLTPGQDSQIFAGKSIYVINGTSLRTKQELEAALFKAGAEIVQSCAADDTHRTWCAVAGKRKNPRLDNIIKDGQFDVVKATWVDACLQAGYLLPFTRSQMWHTTAATEAEISRSMDQFGDSYTEDLTSAGFREIQESIRNGTVTAEVLEPSVDVIREMEFEFDEVPKYGLFRGAKVFLDYPPPSAQRDCSPLDAVALQVEMHGGSIAQEPSVESGCTHVIFDPDDRARVGDFKGGRSAPRDPSHPQLHLVSSDWVQASLKRKARAPEDAYRL